MILSGKKIHELHEKGDIKITPFCPGDLNPNSYNLHLGSVIKEVLDCDLSMKRPYQTSRVELTEKGMVLEPGKLYLGHTLEHTFAKTVVPMIEGRSSIGRLGMFVHVTAGFGDVGFNGHWTLEIMVAKPLKVFPGVPICQIFFHAIDGDYDSYTSDKYQGQVEPRESGLWREFSRPLGETDLEKAYEAMGDLWRTEFIPSHPINKNHYVVSFGMNGFPDTMRSVDIAFHGFPIRKELDHLLSSMIESIPECTDCVIVKSIVDKRIYSKIKKISPTG